MIDLIDFKISCLKNDIKMKERIIKMGLAGRKEEDAEMELFYLKMELYTLEIEQKKVHSLKRTGF